MNRQARRRAKRDRGKIQEDYDSANQSLDNVHLLAMINVSKLASMLALRNRGWGKKRLLEYSEDFDLIINDMSHGTISSVDITETLMDETGVTMEQTRMIKAY